MIAVWEGWTRLAAFAAVVTLWFTANAAVTGKEQAQTSLWQAQLAAQGQKDANIANALSQLSAGSAVARTAGIYALRQLALEIPTKRQYIDVLVRDYLWSSIPANRCVPNDEISSDVHAAFAGAYDDFKIMHFDAGPYDGGNWAVLACMKRTSSDMIEVKWRGHSRVDNVDNDGYSATLHINKNVLSTGTTDFYLSCTCFNMAIFTTRSKHAIVNLENLGRDAKEPFEMSIEI